MAIKFSNIANSINSRANCYFYSAKIIIDYSEATKDSSQKAIYLLNLTYQEFSEHDSPEIPKLELYLGKICGILNSFFISNGIDSNLEYIKDNLSQAEHIYNWLFRVKSKLDPILVYSDSNNLYEPRLHKGFLQVMEQTPMLHFTKALTDEWLKILQGESKRPIWFKNLPLWQKKIFSIFVKIWVEREKLADKDYRPDYFTKLPEDIQNHYIKLISLYHKRKVISTLNLGVILGLQPGSEDPYPATRNGYRTKLCNYMYTPEVGLSLLKKSTSIRVGIPAIINEVPEEQERLTIMCIEQTILYEIIHQYKVGLILSGMKRKLIFPILIQTLESKHRSMTDEKIMGAFVPAFNKVRQSLKDPDYCHKFLNDNVDFLRELVQKNNSIKNPKKFLSVILSKGVITFDLYHSHHDFISDSPRKNNYFFDASTTVENLENYYSTAMMHGIAIDGVTIIDNPKINKIKKLLIDNDPVQALKLIDELPEGTNIKYKIATLRIGLDALSQYKSYQTIFYKCYSKFNKRISLELASYINIAFSAIGIRIGGGPNGCDIESPLNIWVNSLRIFHNAMGFFPKLITPFESSIHRDEREILHLKAAEQFLSGYCQEILEKSSQGCYGVTHLDKTLSDGVLTQIKFLLRKYGLLISTDFLYSTNHQISMLENIIKVYQFNNSNKTAIDDVMKKFDNLKENEYQNSKFMSPQKLMDISYNFRNDETIFLMRIHRNFDISSIDELMKSISKKQFATPSLSSSAKKLSSFASNFRKGDIIKTRISHIEDKEVPLTYDEKINSFIAKAESDSSTRVNR